MGTGVGMGGLALVLIGQLNSISTRLAGVERDVAVLRFKAFGIASSSPAQPPHGEAATASMSLFGPPLPPPQWLFNERTRGGNAQKENTVERK